MSLVFTSQASYYYKHPEAMAAIYLAARTFSILGSCMAVIALYGIGCRLWNRTTAVWGSCFYALMPAQVVNAHIAKPHTWAAAWVFAALYYSLVGKETKSAICYGLSIGTEISQGIFLPLMIWAWGGDWKVLIRSSLIAGFIFIATNFTIFNHLQDFRDELYEGSHYYTWGISVRALRDGLWIMYGAMGPFLAPIAFAGWVEAFVHGDWTLWTLSMACVVVFCVTSFQAASFHGLAWMSRFYLSLYGVLCLFAGWIVTEVVNEKSAQFAG